MGTGPVTPLDSDKTLAHEKKHVCGFPLKRTGEIPLGLCHHYSVTFEAQDVWYVIVDSLCVTSNGALFGLYLLNILLQTNFKMCVLNFFTDATLRSNLYTWTAAALFVTMILKLSSTCFGNAIYSLCTD